MKSLNCMQAWEEFAISYDAAFVHAILDELVAYAEEFGMGLSDLLVLNAKRSAGWFN